MYSCTYHLFRYITVWTFDCCVEVHSYGRINWCCGRIVGPAQISCASGERPVHGYCTQLLSERLPSQSQALPSYLKVTWNLRPFSYLLGCWANLAILLISPSTNFEVILTLSTQKLLGSSLPQLSAFPLLSLLPQPPYFLIAYFFLYLTPPRLIARGNEGQCFVEYHTPWQTL